MSKLGHVTQIHIFVQVISFATERFRRWNMAYSTAWGWT